MIEASPTRPGRILYIQNPVTSAAGMVTTIVNMPQALSFRALTTTIATPARVATMMKSVAIVVAVPAIGTEEISRDLRQRQAVEADRGHQHDKVVDPACQAGPDDDPGEAREKSPLGGKHRADQRPRPGDRGEVDAKQHQSPRRLVVDVVAEPMRGGDALVVQDGHAGGQEGPIEPIGHRKGRQGRDYQPK